MTCKHYTFLLIAIFTLWGIGNIAQSEPGVTPRFSGKFVGSGGQSDSGNLTLHGAIGDVNSSQMTSSGGTFKLVPQNLTFGTLDTTVEVFLPSIQQLPPTPTPTPCLAQDIEPTNATSDGALMLDSICTDGRLIEGYIEESGSGGDVVDVYWIRLRSTKKLEIIQQNMSGQDSAIFTLALYNRNNPTQPEKDIADTKQSKRINITLDEGEYFIVITSAKENGAYTLTVNATNVSD